MAFLPFYVPRPEPLNLVIIGGGYAGIAALSSLRRHCPAAHITLIDPGLAHIKITHLHETFRRKLSEFIVPYANIAERFACRHVHAALDINDGNLEEWHENRGLAVCDEFLDCDYLVIATGAGASWLEKHESTYDLGDFMQTDGSVLMERLPRQTRGVITVVGGGATGVQFLFEIASFIRSQGLPLAIRLVDGEDHLLKQFAPDLGRYAQTRIADLGIEYLPRTFYEGQQKGAVVLRGRDDGRCFELESCASFLFPGRQPSPMLTTNIFGQVLVGGKVLTRVFAAGDCANFRGVGSNTLTAQAAVRKGKLTARNILRHSGRLKILEPYLHRDMGYVISLGPTDAVGWLALEGNVVGGYPALVFKELVEAQYDLLLAGIDTYVI
jgi:NADH dehydrogenase